VDLIRLEIIPELPVILAVQSRHANPVYTWRSTGEYAPMKVKPSVAQAAMIGDPVSFPKVRKLVAEHFNELFIAVELEEQEIIEGMLLANRHGHVVCSQGGESIAGLKKAVSKGLIKKSMTVIVDSTSHQLKFSNFQEMYFKDSFPEEYEIKPQKIYSNKPVELEASSEIIADFLKLKKKQRTDIK
jgi:threonine synthase